MLPVVVWLPRYEHRWLRGDLAAGIAVTALVVPKNLGYAGIAGIPLQNGLYAAAAGAIIYALFCTSRHISTGPSSSLAAVAGGAVLATGLGGDQAAQLVAAIALATGLLFLVLALFRMGWIASFLSRAVVTGFLAGAAVDVVVGELPKLTGTSAEGESAWRELASWLGSLGDTHATTVLVGATALGVVLGLRRLAPAVPGALVLVGGGLVASSLFDLGAHGVALVGEVPSGLPVAELPDLELVRDHSATVAISAVALLLIGFSQTAGDARAFAARHHYRVDVNQESVAQGMANIGAGVFQGMPVSTSLSASSLNESAGARTPAASLVTAVTKPDWMIPVHGEYRHLAAHADLARQMGVAADHVLLCEDGDRIELGDKGSRRLDSVPAGYLYVDGTVGDVGDGVLRDRKVLAEDGVVVVIVTVDMKTGAIITRSRDRHPGLGLRAGGRGPARRAADAVRKGIKDAVEKDGDVDSRPSSATCARPRASSSATRPSAGR